MHFLSSPECVYSASVVLMTQTHSYDGQGEKRESIAKAQEQLIGTRTMRSTPHGYFRSIIIDPQVHAYTYTKK